MSRQVKDDIIESLVNGQFKQAVEQTLYRARTRPLKLACRVGRVIGCLCDPDGFHRNPDLAATYLRVLENHLESEES